MRFLPALTAFVLMGSASLPGALAFGSRDVPLNFAQRGVDVKVTPEGCSIDFGRESIAAITISDRRQILVRKMGNSSVYLQRIQRQNIEGMLGMPDGTAVLRVWTTSGKRLSFRLTVGNSGGKDISIVPAADRFAARPARPALPPPMSLAPTIDKPINQAPAPVAAMPSSNPYPLVTPIPDSFQRPAEPPLQKLEKPHKKEIEQSIDSSKTTADNPPAMPLRAFAEAKSPEPVEAVKPQIQAAIVQTVKPYKPSLNQAQAGAILKGLNAAKLKKGKEKIAFLSPDWNKTQSVIRSLKRGKSLDVAINKAQSNRSFIEKLLKEGGYAE